MINNQHQVDLNTALEKEKQLEKKLSALKSALVAYSGGVDSTYLLYKAAEVIGREKVLAVTVHSELNTSEEVEDATAVARDIKANHLVLKINLLDVKEIAENYPERCYFCKNLIYNKLLSIAEKKNYALVVDGSNADDEKESRPGLRALKELGICSPLLGANLNKGEIRFLSKRSGLAAWEKPVAACLATRFPYGEKITTSKLNLVSAAENYLRQLGVSGNLRVRNHRNLARIEVSEDDISLLLSHKKSVADKLSALGFIYVTLDLRGFSSGSMDLIVKP